MKKLFTLLLLCTAAKTYAQVPEDAIKYSWYTQNGTARTLAIGGAIGALGGDITAGFVNPAGIGFYHTNEATISPNFSFGKLKASYPNTTTTNLKSKVNVGPTGAVFALPNFNNGNKSAAVAIAFMQTANFNKNYSYSGLNNYSSFTGQIAEEFVGLNKSISEVLNSNSISPYTVAPALYTYLIDTVRQNGTLIVKGAPEYILDAGQALLQKKSVSNKGGMYELGLSFAGNDEDKWLWGATLGIPIIQYESTTTFSEADTSKNLNNYFNNFTFTDNYTTKGVGINGKFGVIFRPKTFIRLGLALHTPSYLALTDSRVTTLQSVVENPKFDTVITSKTFTNWQAGEAKYIQNAPLKVIGSAAYVFREIEDVTKQRGFVGLDVEYVSHRGSRFSSDATEPTTDDKAYYKKINAVIKDIYKSNVNIKLGGEVKFNTIMARLGAAYYGSPYKNAPTAANKITLSGGLGYRNKGFFVDATYVYLTNKDFDVPYRTQNEETVYAKTTLQQSTIALTVGVKF